MSTSKATVFAKYYRSISRITEFQYAEDRSDFFDLMKHFEPFVEEDAYIHYLTDIDQLGDKASIQGFLALLAQIQDDMEQEKTAVSIAGKGGGDDDDDDAAMDADEYVAPENEEDRKFIAKDDELEFESEKAKKKHLRRLKKNKKGREEDHHAALLHQKEQEDSEEDQQALQPIFRKGAESRHRPAAVPAAVVHEPKPQSLSIAMEADFTQEPQQSSVEATETALKNLLDGNNDDNDDEKTDDDIEEGDEEGGAADEEGGDEGDTNEEGKKRGGKKRKATTTIEAPEKRKYKVGETFVLKGKVYEVKYTSPYKVPVKICDDQSVDVLWDKVTPDMVSNLWGTPLGNKTEPDYVSCVMTEEGGPFLITLQNATKIEGKTKTKLVKGKISQGGRHPLMDQAKNVGNVVKVKTGEIKTFMCMNYFRHLTKDQKDPPAPSVIKTNPEANRLLERLNAPDFNNLSTKFVDSFMDGLLKAPNPKGLLTSLGKSVKALEQDLENSVARGLPVFQCFTSKHGESTEKNMSSRECLSFLLWNMVILHPHLRDKMKQHLATL